MMGRSISVPGPPLSKWETAIIGFGALMIFVAWDGTFNMQTFLPITLILLFGFVLKCGNHSFDKKSIVLTVCALASCAVSTLTCVLVSPEAVTASSLIRFAYIGMILVFFFIVVNRSYTHDQVKWIIKANVFSGAIIAAGVVIRSLSLGGQSGKIAVTNIWGIPLETNYLGALLAFELILAVALVHRTKRPIERLCFAGLCGVIMCGIFFTGSRAALLGSLLGLGVLTLYYLFQHRESASVGKKLVLIAFLAIGAFVALQLMGLLPDWYLNRFFRNSYVDVSNTHRLAIWEYGWAGFLERPLFGYGIGNFNYYFRIGIDPSSTTVVAHNTYLDALIDMGLIGSSIFFLLLFSRLKGVENSGLLMALIVVLVFTSFIVGGERTFFFWNGVIILNILCRFENPKRLQSVTVGG